METAKDVTSDKYNSLGDCYEACRDEMSLECQSFSFCRGNGEAIRCILSSELIKPDASNETMVSNLDRDTSCTTWMRSYISRFEKIEGRVTLLPGGKQLETSAVSNELDCARQCTYEKDFQCQSFEYCSNKRCILRKDHFVDKTAVKEQKLVTNVDCDLYSREQ